VLIAGATEHETLANPYTYREDASTWKEAE
jgi:hypothetical protein